MTGQEAIAYIHSFNWEKHEPGLRRIRALLHALGDPQRGLKFVHVAGTNGKGSTCALLESVLRYAGYRVGMHTPPNCCQARVCPCCLNRCAHSSISSSSTVR